MVSSLMKYTSRSNQVTVYVFLNNVHDLVNSPLSVYNKFSLGLRERDDSNVNI